MREINLKFKNQLSELAFIRGKIDEFIGKEINSVLKNRIILSVDEAISNVMEHGFPDLKESDISLNVQLTESKIKFVLEDEGIPFNPLTAKPVDIEEHLELGEDGGVGIHIVQKIMQVEYERTLSKNRLLLTKNLTEEI